MLTVKKLFDDLDYWIHIGIADDIVSLPYHRPEYQHLVAQAKTKTTEPENIPIVALALLETELKKPWFMQKTFWVLLKITIKQFFYNRKP